MRPTLAGFGRLRVWATLLGAILASSPAVPAAAGGPWPQATGGGLLALSGGVSWDEGRGRGVARLHTAFGYSERLTFGASIEQVGPDGTFDIFASWHPQLALLGRSSSTGMTLGARLDPSGRLRGVAGAHLGHGFDLAGGMGAWARVGVTGYTGAAGGGIDADVFSQLGLRPWGDDGAFGMVTTSMWVDGEGNRLRIAPAVGQPIGAGRSLIIEFETDASGGGNSAVTLGLWQQF